MGKGVKAAWERDKKHHLVYYHGAGEFVGMSGRVKISMRGGAGGGCLEGRNSSCLAFEASEGSGGVR